MNSLFFFFGGHPPQKKKPGAEVSGKIDGKGEGEGAEEGGRGGGGGEDTLQKSIDLTPLEPRAGPTGGLGLACPAPTISLTICSLARGGLGAMEKSWGGKVILRCR